jgi:hypothetical protein
VYTNPLFHVLPKTEPASNARWNVQWRGYCCWALQPIRDTPSEQHTVLVIARPSRDRPLDGRDAGQMRARTPTSTALIASSSATFARPPPFIGAVVARALCARRSPPVLSRPEKRPAPPTSSGKGHAAGEGSGRRKLCDCREDKGACSPARLCAQTFHTFVYATAAPLISLNFLPACS